MSRKPGVVIIGSSAAAVSAAKALRAGDPEINISIYSEEKVLPYFRPSLSFALAAQPPEPRPMNKPEFYTSSNIAMNLGMTAVSIDRKQKTVRFADGSKVPYQSLLLAVGASCFVPPIPGVTLPGVLSLRDQADLERLLDFLKIPRQILLIGGGMLGLELAATLLQMRHRVTIVECAPYLLNSQLDEAGGKFYTKLIESTEGLEIITGSAVKELSGDEHVSGATLTNGGTLDCNLAIVSAGARSNIKLARNCGLECRHGIVVDDFMRTDDPAILAAGDCAEVQCRSFGLWEPALAQGKTAALTILGQPEAFTCRVYGATLNVFGTKLYSIGIIGGDDCREFQDNAKNTLRQIFFADGRVIGGYMIGDTSAMMALNRAVNEQQTEEQAAANGLI